MTPEDLFPLCPRDKCDIPNPTPAADGHHRHVLEHQRRLIESEAKYIGAVGGYGSGKSLAGCVLGVMLSVSIPGNLGIVARRSYSKLHDSTQKIFFEVLARAGVEWQGKEMRDGWYHRIIFPDNGSEVVFRETKDIGRFLGPEYGWFYIDEAQEEPEDTFTRLMGRLRLPRADGYLRGILTTNPPHQTHWFAKTFGEDGAKWIGGSRYETIHSSSRVNPFLPPEYIKDLEAHYPPSEVKRIIEGFYGFSFEGRPVFAPPFEFTKHVGAPLVHPMTTIRSWDFGFRHPAVTFHQFFRCKSRKIHWHILAEYSRQNIESEPFATEVLQYSKVKFERMVSKHLWADFGDAAGAQRSEKGPGPILRLAQPPWNLKFCYRKFPNIDPGLDIVRKALREPRCSCGFPTLLIHRECRDTIDMFSGGYHYARDNSRSPSQAEKPVKDLFYDDYADSVRYAGELGYRMAARDPDIFRQLDQAAGITDKGEEAESWAWMGL